MRRAARFLLYTLRPYLLILPTAATGAALLLPRIAGGTDGPAAALCNALPGFGLLFLLMFLWPACRLILASPAVWGDLPLLLLLALPAAAALLELPLCRAMIRLSVR